MARDLTERITVEQVVFDASGSPTGRYAVRERDVPARLFRATGDQIYTEDTLRLEHTLTFQIRHREITSTDRVLWDGRTLEIRAIIDLVPGKWLELRCRASE